MGWENIRVIREELHEKIWSQPITKVAKEYGISDVGLGKICKKLNVPRPPQGYWLKKNQRQPPSLPPTKGPTEHLIQKWVEPEHELDTSQKTEREILIGQENLPRNLIRVDERTGNMHRMVLITQDQLLKEAAKKKTLEDSWVRGGAKSLDICVSPALIDRAVHIMNALVTALENRKHVITIEDGRTYVSVLGEKFSINLEEPATRIDRNPTDEEKSDLEKHPWMTIQKYDYIPSGKLSLKIDKSSYGARRSWNDGKKRRIEDCLNSIIIGLLEASFTEKARRAEKERSAREWEERERRRKEKQEAIRQEKARVSQLEADANNWHKSQMLRAYIEAVRKKPDIGGIGSGEELSRWVAWAIQQADRLDPLIESPPSVLDEED